MPYRLVVLCVLAAVALMGCGSDSDDEAEAPTPVATGEQAPTATPETTPTPTRTPRRRRERAARPTCQEPSGQEKGALRFAVRAHDRELKDSPWARVRERGINYMAAEIDGPGPRLVVLVRYPESGQYLAGMKALNGTARTFTDLPEGGDTIPKAGEQALDCLGSG